jgi:hypothetical protein
VRLTIAVEMQEILKKLAAENVLLSCFVPGSTHALHTNYLSELKKEVRNIWLRQSLNRALHEPYTSLKRALTEP